MRAVVIGGSGQIGGWLVRHLTERGHDVVGTYATVAFPGLVHLDAAEMSAAASWLRAQRPDVVFYPAGFTWVDGCERDPARARAANLDQPRNLARAAADLGARFVYFSTDYVFDGRDGPYDETAPTHPLSVYGRAKRDAERALAEALGEAQLTLRTCWVYGPERQGKNFAYQVARALRQGQPLVCPCDQVSSPSYGPDVARVAVALAEAGASGLFHVAGPEILDRATFARKLAVGLGLDPAPVTATTTDALSQVAARPLQSGLITNRLDPSLRRGMRPIAEALADFRARIRDEPIWAHP